MTAISLELVRTKSIITPSSRLLSSLPLVPFQVNRFPFQSPAARSLPSGLNSTDLPSHAIFTCAIFLPVLESHRRIAPLVLSMAMTLPLGDQATLDVWGGSSQTACSLPLAISQILPPFEATTRC